MTAADIKIEVGEKVGVDDPKWPGVWVIRSIGPKNVVLDPEKGGRGLKVPPWALTKPPTVLENGVIITELAPYVPYDGGEVVRLRPPDYPGLYVVISDKGEKVNVAKLGGDNGRYLRANRTWLQKVDLTEILK